MTIVVHSPNEVPLTFSDVIRYDVKDTGLLVLQRAGGRTVVWGVQAWDRMEVTEP